MSPERPRRRGLALFALALVLLAVGGAVVWRLAGRPEPRSATRLCQQLANVSSLSQSIVTLDPTLLGPQIAELQRATEVAPSDIQAQLTVLVDFVTEIADEVRASPTEKKKALTDALAERQARVDEVSAAGQVVEEWSVANCGAPLRSTTTARVTTTVER